MEHYLTGYEQFLQNISKSRHTVKQYVLDAKHFIRFWSHQEQEELAFSDVIAAYRAYLQQTYKVTTINRKLAGTRKFVLFMYDRDYIDSFNDALFEPFEKEQPALHYLTKGQIHHIQQTLHQLLQQAKDEEEQFLATRHIAMFELFYTTGIKPFEAIRMQWQHIEDDQLTVLHNDQYRHVTLTANAKRALTALKRQNELLVGPNDYVWLGLGNKRGEPITEKTIERCFQALSKYVGLKVTATVCRYTFMKYADDNVFEQAGYTRKDNMKERLNKLQPKDKV